MFIEFITENVTAGNNTIKFISGLTVFEKGVENGRTEVFDAIAVLLGSAEASTVLSGSGNVGKISGIFDNIPDSLWHAAEKLGSRRADTLTLTREISADGSTVCYLNGAQISVAQANNICGKLFVLHGRGSQTNMLDESRHLYMLDSFLDNHDKIEAYKHTFRELAKSRKSIALLSADEQERNKQMEVLRKEIAEIEHANLQTGELEKLTALLQLLKHEEEISSTLNSIIMHLCSEESGAHSKVAKASAEADILAGGAGLQNLQLQNIASALKTQLQALNMTEAYAKEQLQNIHDATKGISLDDVQARCNLIISVAEKHGGSVEAAISYAEQAWVELMSVEFGAEQLEKLQKNEGILLLNVKNAAEELTVSRKASFDALNSAVSSIAKNVGIPDFSLQMKHETVSPGPIGLDHIELFAFYNGEARPLKTLSERNPSAQLGISGINSFLTYIGIPTLFYDDVDKGMPAESSAVVAPLLKRSIKGKQVVCVAATAAFRDAAAD